MNSTSAVGAAEKIAFFIQEYGIWWMKMNQALLPVAQFNPSARQEIFKITFFFLAKYFPCSSHFLTCVQSITRGLLSFAPHWILYSRRRLLSHRLLRTHWLSLFRVLIWEDGSLEILNVTRADEGRYTCFAENDRGKANSTGSLLVTGDDQLLKF